MPAVDWLRRYTSSLPRVLCAQLARPLWLQVFAPLNLSQQTSGGRHAYGGAAAVAAALAGPQEAPSVAQRLPAAFLRCRCRVFGSSNWKALVHKVGTYCTYMDPRTNARRQQRSPHQCCTLWRNAGPRAGCPALDLIAPMHLY